MKTFKTYGKPKMTLVLHVAVVIITGYIIYVKCMIIVDEGRIRWVSILASVRSVGAGHCSVQGCDSLSKKCLCKISIRKDIIHCTDISDGYWIKIWK